MNSIYTAEEAGLKNKPIYTIKIKPFVYWLFKIVLFCLAQIWGKY